MFASISKILITELVYRTNIVDLINHKIPLKKRGNNFVACCPFHQEKHPSFTVNPKKQFYYCFSCGSHGNVINFLMHYDRLTFIECIKKLSAIHGIKIKNSLNEIKTKIRQEKKVYQFMHDVCTYYQNNLKNKKYLYAYKYLKNRGLNDNSILKFRIGFAPLEKNNITKNLNIKLYDQKSINQSGMWINFNTNQQYDRFRKRIMFPMLNETGHIIAFGSRTIINSIYQPKYLNSPDTEIFKKKQYLYGFYEIWKKEKKIPYVLLVEGYIDVIILTQFGINYVVASLGTCISTQHIKLIYKITNQIIFCYDGDTAGRKAAWRTLSIILPYLTDNREIYFMFLPNQEDPDTLIRKIGKDKFLKKISQSKSLSNFLFETLSKKTDLTTLEGRIKFIQLILPMINKIPGKIQKLLLRQKLSIQVGILDDNKLDQILTKKLHLSKYTKNNNDITHNIEHILIGLLIQNPKLAKLVPTTKGLENYKHDKMMVFINLVKLCKSYPTINTEQLLQHYYYKNDFNNCSVNLTMLACWKHMIANNMIIITFIDTLIRLYNLILEQRQNILISQDRTLGLTKQEQKELWLLNQTLSIH